MLGKRLANLFAENKKTAITDDTVYYDVVDIMGHCLTSNLFRIRPGPCRNMNLRTITVVRYAISTIFACHPFIKIVAKKYLYN
jgi:hypothetical protein